MVDPGGIFSDPSLAHVERADLRDPVVSDQPLIGPFNKEADLAATEKYFHRQNPVTPMTVGADNRKPDHENVRILVQAKTKSDPEDEGRVLPGLVDLLSRPSPFLTKDSGQREDFPTGSKRDTREGKGRYDLLSPYAIKRLAQVYERGSVKYGDNNWRLGQPLSRFLDSALRHTFQVLDGRVDEDHAGQAVWNLMAFIETQYRIETGELPAHLDDM